MRHLESQKIEEHKILKEEEEFQRILYQRTSRLWKSSRSVSATEQLIAACVELVTVNGRPFTLLDDSGFRKIINPIVANLPEKPIINRKTIPHHIDAFADNLRSSIIKELKGKMLSLKIDGVVRHLRSVIGVNVQFIHSNS